MIFDKIKRRLMFWKYSKINIDISNDIYLFIKDEARKRKISIDAFIDMCLIDFIKSKQGEKNE